MSWSGSFRNEHFVGPGAYQAKTGVRCFMDLRTNPGPVVVTSPVDPEDNSSFILSWDNPGRHLITLVSPAAETFEDLVSIQRSVVPEASTNFLHAGVALTFVGGTWEVFDWSLFSVALNTTFAVAWIGRATNGICTLTGSYKGVDVERTGVGFYTVRITPGILTPPTLIVPAPVATGLPAETSPELRVEDVGMATVDEILINSGTRNKNGQFTDDDLTQDAANFMAILGQKFP